MMEPKRKAVRDAALISVAAIIIAGIFLLSTYIPAVSVEVSNGLLLITLGLGVVAWVTLVARRNGQAHLALGVYLLLIGGVWVGLPFRFWLAFGQNDMDAIPFLLGVWYLFVGLVLLVGSLISLRRWASGLRATLVRTLLLAGPGTILIIVFFLVRGPNEWRGTLDGSPFGLHMIVASWLVGIGIFLAGSRFVKEDSALALGS